MDAIVSYKPVADTEGEDAIVIKIRPAPDEEVYSEGNDAKIVKALFNKQKPEE
jgi:hypothetical protein